MATDAAPRIIAFLAYYPAAGIDGKGRRYEKSVTFCPPCGQQHMRNDATGADYMTVRAGSHINPTRCNDCRRAIGGEG